eukprot:2732178-Pyramimonas_sp.AAC.1
MNRWAAPPAVTASLTEGTCTHIETEEVKPDYDVNPTGEWVIVGDTERYTEDNQRIMGVYSPEGRWRGELAEDKMERPSTIST